MEMKIRIIKDFEIVPGRTLKKGTTHVMFSDHAKRCVDCGCGIDLDGEYTRKGVNVIEKRKLKKDK